VVSLESSGFSIACFCILAVATSLLQLNPESEVGGKSDWIGPLKEAGRTDGRSNAKDCADVVFVVRWLLEHLRSCGLPQRA
jgi:hypothetical protein